MVIHDDMVVLETEEQGGNQYRIIHTHEFDGLFFSYIDNDVHSNPPPTRLVEYFENCDSTSNIYQHNAAVIHKNRSWSEVIDEAKNYAREEIRAVTKRNDRCEMPYVLPTLERIVKM